MPRAQWRPSPATLADEPSRRLFRRLASLLLALPARATRDEFPRYGWNDHLAPETRERFEALCKCTVVQTYFLDNEELLARLAAAANVAINLCRTDRVPGCETP